MQGAQAQFDFAAVMERVSGVVKAIEPHDSVERYSGLGVDVVEGTATIRTPWEVEIKAPTAACAPSPPATSSSPPGAPAAAADSGLADMRAAHLDTVWNLRVLPKRLWCWAAARSAAS